MNLINRILGWKYRFKLRTPMFNYTYDEKIEQNKKDKFKELHYKECGCSRFILYENQTGMGETTVITCSECDEELNITNFDNW